MKCGLSAQHQPCSWAEQVAAYMLVCEGCQEDSQPKTQPSPKHPTGPEMLKSTILHSVLSFTGFPPSVSSLQMQRILGAKILSH